MFEKHMWKSGILSKVQAIDLNLYFKCHSSSGVFQTFCLQKPTAWFLHKWNIGQKWVKQYFYLLVFSFVRRLMAALLLPNS